MEIVSIQEHKNNIVVKQQSLVWEARYKLSELGIKVVAILISMINKDDEDFKEYNLKLSDFKELIGSNSNKTYEYVDVMTDELMKKPFKIGDEKFNWVYYAKYHKGDSYVTLKIVPELKPYLLQIQGKYLKYNIINILPLKSGYIIRLYELLKSKWSEYNHYHKQAKSYQFDIKIDWLREQFDIPKSYQYSSHIKERILEKAKKDFKKYTDIQFEYQEQKIGRKVDRLIITIKPNHKKIDKKVVPANNYPIEVTALKGTEKFSNDGDFITAYEDGSFQLKKADGTYIYFKSLKQFIYMLHNQEF